MLDDKAMKSLLELSRLEVAPDELPRLERQLREIIGYFERLAVFDTSGVDVNLGVARPVEESRADQSRPGIVRERIDEFAPHFDGRLFVVPQILGETDE